MNVDKSNGMSCINRLEHYTSRNRHVSGSSKTHERYSGTSQQQKEHKTPPRQTSNDDVFLGPETPASNDDGTSSTVYEENNTGTIRQTSRNWADCPIDETAADTASPPPSANTTFTGDDFQVTIEKLIMTEGNGFLHVRIGCTR
jgi:hypothetical protein